MDGRLYRDGAGEDVEHRGVVDDVLQLGRVACAANLPVQRTVLRVVYRRQRVVLGVVLGLILFRSQTAEAALLFVDRLLIFADGDDDWRREQNRRFQQELLEQGNQVVELLEVSGRNHLSIWSQILEPQDPTSRAMIEFVLREEK